MIRHVLTLIWRRKRSGTLILLEIAVCFLVLCALFTIGLYGWENSRRPLGFDYRDVWLLEIGNQPQRDDPLEERLAAVERARQLAEAVRAMPEVQSAAWHTNVPYSRSSTNATYRRDGRETDILSTATTPEARDLLRLELVGGRWIEPGDETREEEPVVVDRRLAALLFGDENPVGRILPEFDHEEAAAAAAEGKPEPARRVVGLVAAYRRGNPLSAEVPVLFTAWRLDDPDTWFFPNSLLVRTRPGAAPSFEDALSRLATRLEPRWSYDIRTLDAMRQSKVASQLLPLMISGIVAAFLLLMVALGLVGVLWQSLLRRKGEMGLRRALGASAAGVRRQILGELAAHAGLAMIAGTAIFLQAPLLGIPALLGVGAIVPWHIWLAAVTLAAAIILALVLLAGLVPSWMATRTAPAQALQHE